MITVKNGSGEGHFGRNEEGESRWSKERNGGQWCHHESLQPRKESYEREPYFKPTQVGRCGMH